MPISIRITKKKFCWLGIYLTFFTGWSCVGTELLRPRGIKCTRQARNTHATGTRSHDTLAQYLCNACACTTETILTRVLKCCTSDTIVLCSVSLCASWIGAFVVSVRITPWPVCAAPSSGSLRQLCMALCHDQRSSLVADTYDVGGGRGSPRQRSQPVTPVGVRLHVSLRSAAWLPRLHHQRAGRSQEPVWDRRLRIRYPVSLWTFSLARGEGEKQRIPKQSF